VAEARAALVPALRACPSLRAGPGADCTEESPRDHH
jgi:hypothetical protein